MTTIASKPTLQPSKEPPSPPEDRVYGHLLEMRADPLNYLARIAREYGGIVKLRFKRDFVYLVSEPDLIRELLIDNGSRYRKNTRYKFMQKALGQGLLLSEGEVWRAQRRVAAPFFAPKAINERADEVVEIAEQVADSWRDHAATGEPLETEAAFSRLAQRQALRFSVGKLYEPFADEIAKNVEIAVSNWPERPRGRFASLKPPPILRIARLSRSIKRIRALFREIITAGRANHAKANPEPAGMLPALIEAQDASRPLAERDEELCDQLITLFLAAFETSASGLCWTMHQLDQHPDVRTQVVEEVDRVLEGRPVTVDDLPRLECLDRVISESLRLYSPIHSLSRVALEDNSIGGYPIPAGSTVMVSLYATHRLPHHWPDPDRFDPDRFLPEKSEGRNRYAYIPFAVGHRACIGGRQAIVNAKINIATMTQRYLFHLDPTQRVEMDPRTTMRPKYGMRMRLEGRR